MVPVLLKGKRKICKVKKFTFAKNRLGEIIRETVCKLLEDNKEISDSYHGPIKKKSCQGNQSPWVTEAQILWTGKSSQCHVSPVRFLILSSITFLEASKGNVWDGILFGKLRASWQYMVSVRVGGQAEGSACGGSAHPRSLSLFVVNRKQLIKSACGTKLRGTASIEKRGFECNMILTNWRNSTR